MIRGPISMLIVGAVMIIAVMLLALGPRAFEGVLPAAAIDAMESGMMASVEGSARGDTAADFLDDGVDGLTARGPIAARSGNRPVFIRDVISGYTTRVGSDIPAEITKIRPISGCRLTPPLQGTLVGHAVSGWTGLPLPMLTYNDNDLAAAVQAFVDSYRAGRDLARVSLPSGLVYEAYDVAVTETRTPVYLVLESKAANRIWNIHLAPGARVERVILLGGARVGVANLDPVVPVEVLPDEAMTACGIQPAYPLNPGHRFFEVLANGQGSARQEAEAKLVTMLDGIAAYETWFLGSFGVSATESRAGFDGSTLSVIGPQPGEAEPKAVYAPIRGARIRTTQDTYFEIPGQVPEGEDFAGRVKAIAKTFAFGDLRNLAQGVQF